MSALPDARPERAGGLPAGAGLSLKPAHFADAQRARGRCAFYEVHAENHLGAGGPAHRMLEWIRADHALSIHGVGLSIAGMALDAAHLDRIAALVERYEPAVFSEHIAWSSSAGEFLNDLLPVPYNAASLSRVCRHVDQVQTRLKRRILIENPATYIQFEASTMTEGEFLGALVERTGCGLLLDVSNAFVSACNHGRDAWADILGLPLHAAQEIHLAGYAAESDDSGATLLVDAHNGPVGDAVWSLYVRVLGCIGPRPTLIEWDNELPTFDRLLREAARIEVAIDSASHPQRSAA